MKYKGWNVLVFALLVSLLTACQTSSPTPPAEATVNGVTKIDRSTGEAEFSVSALDKDGELLTSGTISNVSATVDQVGFAVEGDACEDGEITDKGPLTAVLTLDASGSMGGNDPTKQRAVGAKLFVDRMSLEDEAAVTSFEGRNFITWTDDFTSDKATLYTAIDEAAYIGGGTPLWDAASGVITQLNTSTGTNKVAVIFTDGEDTGSGNSPQNVINQAVTAGVRVFMIGLGTPRTIEVNRMLDVATGTSGFYADVETDAELTLLFDNAFSASKASGCIGISFTPVPVAGSSLNGELSFKVNGKAFTGAYSVTF